LSVFFVFWFYDRILAFPVVFASCYLVVWWRFGFTRAGILQGKKGRVGHVKKGNSKTKKRIRESGGGGTSREEVLRGKRNSGQVGMGWD
jgi:hypothetical protein